MPSPKRRAKVHRPGGLLPSERLYLRFGRSLGTLPPPRWQRVSVVAGINEYSIDEAAARAQWREFRDEITAEAASYTPWAAIAFDGAEGPITPYDTAPYRGNTQTPQSYTATSKESS